MSIIQALVGAIVSGSGGPPPTPNAFAGYSGTPTEGSGTDVTVTVENWNGNRIYWSVVGKGNPAVDPNTDMTGTLSGFWDPGVVTSASQTVTTVNFTADGTAEGTEYWGVNLGSSPGASDYFSGGEWAVTEPIFYNSWTIEWFQKSNASQPSPFPRVFGMSTYPNQTIGFSMEGVYYGWFAGSGIATSINRIHDTWQHWVMVTNGEVFSMYKDGVRVASVSRAANYGQLLDTANSFYVGIDAGPANGYKGLITNFRVTKGIAMYDASSTTITVPTAPLGSNAYTELLLKATDVGNAYADSSSRDRTAAGLGSNSFSADTPFTAPTPAGPYTQYTNITLSGGGYIGGGVDFSGGNYNADLLNVKTGWIVTNGVTSGYVVEDAFEIIPGTIRINLSIPTTSPATWTFTQYQVGGSIEFYTSSYGMILYEAGTEWALDIPSPTFSAVPRNATVNEGGSVIVDITTTGFPDGNVYFTVSGVSASDILSGVLPSGDTYVNSGSSTVSFMLAEDLTTEGVETLVFKVRTGSTTGPVVASCNVTINDTSLTKVQLTSGTSLAFNGTDNRHVIVEDNLADWNLGDNWTIEWWQKIPVGASGFLSVLCQDANVPTYSGIDVFINAGNIQMFNGNFTVSEAPATRGEWNHIAIQNSGGTLSAYINGVSQSVGASHSGSIVPSSPLNLVIGSRTADGGATFYNQYFNGQLANIRISDIARYTGTFTVPTTVVTDANTKLSLDGSSGGDGMLTDELARHTITNVGAVEDSVIGYKLVIATNDGSGLVGWGPNSLAVAANPFIISTFAAGSTITFQDNTIATITAVEDYTSYIDISWDTPKTGTLFPITLKTADYPL